MPWCNILRNLNTSFPRPPADDLGRWRGPISGASLSVKRARTVGLTRIELAIGAEAAPNHRNDAFSDKTKGFQPGNLRKPLPAFVIVASQLPAVNAAPHPRRFVMLALLAAVAADASHRAAAQGRLEAAIYRQHRRHSDRPRQLDHRDFRRSIHRRGERHDDRPHQVLHRRPRHRRRAWHHRRPASRCRRAMARPSPTTTRSTTCAWRSPAAM